MATTATELHLIRPSVVARTLGISRASVYALITSGQLPGVRIGKSVRVRSDVVERVLTEGIPARGDGDG